MKGGRNEKNIKKTNGNRKRVPRKKGADCNSSNDGISEGKEVGGGKNERSRDMRTKGAGQQQDKENNKNMLSKGCVRFLESIILWIQR